MDKEKFSGFFQEGLIAIPSATAMTRANKTGISIYANGGTGRYTKSIVSGAGIIGTTGSIIPNPSYEKLQNSKVVIRVSDTAGESTELIVEVGQPIDVVASILQKEMQLSPEQVILWNQGLPTPPEASVYMVMSIPSTTIISKTNRYVDSGDKLLRIDSISTLDIVHIDISSRTTEALIRKMEPLLALTSDYAQQQQMENIFKMSITTREVMNTIDLQPSYSPYRFRHAFILHSCAEYISNVPYYDRLGDLSLITGD